MYFEAAIEGELPTAEDARSLFFRGCEYKVYPADLSKRLLPRLRVGIEQGLSGFDAYDNGLERINRFLSALCWTFSAQVAVRSGVATNRGVVAEQARILVKGSLGSGITLFATDDPHQLQVLALYREAINAGVIYPAVAVLAFFRIVEVAVGQGRSRFVNFAADCFSGKDEPEDIAKTLYTDRRCAAAHAATSNRFDPDDPTQYRVYKEDIPKFKALAETAMIEVLSIPSASDLEAYWIEVNSG